LVPIDFVSETVPSLKVTCQSRSCRTNRSLCWGIHCRKIGASRKLVRVFLCPANDTSVALPRSVKLCEPQTNNASDSGLHCGVLDQLDPIEPRSRVCAMSATLEEFAGITRNTPSSFT